MSAWPTLSGNFWSICSRLAEPPGSTIGRHSLNAVGQPPTTAARFGAAPAHPWNRAHRAEVDQHPLADVGTVYDNSARASLLETDDNQTNSQVVSGDFNDSVDSEEIDQRMSGPFQDFTPEQYSRVSQLLDQSIELPPAEREAWLTDLGARDPQAAALLRRALRAQQDCWFDGSARLSAGAGLSLYQGPPAQMLCKLGQAGATVPGAFRCSKV